jgi:hypothetical protein
LITLYYHELGSLHEGGSVYLTATM